MLNFKCKHPAKFLALYSHKDIVEPIDKDFIRVTKQLYCTKCDSRVNISAAVFVDMDKFLKENL